MDRYKDLYTNVHSSFIPNSHKLEAPQMSSNRWMNKEIEEYLYNEILLTNEKEYSSRREASSMW